jgi:hypothetical protein
MGQDQGGLMPRSVRNGSLALSLLVFAACGDSIGPGPQTVEEARALWLSHHVLAYSYVGSRASFGGPSGPVRVDVSNGVVTGVTDLTTQGQVATIGWLTIDQLLNLAETLQPQPVEFDRRYGYPKRVERCCMADDSGAVYTVSSVSISLILQSP